VLEGHDGRGELLDHLVRLLALVRLWEARGAAHGGAGQWGEAARAGAAAEAARGLPHRVRALLADATHSCGPREVASRGLPMG
jgi:hypothetical protein